MDRWFAVGHSDAEDPAIAGREATRAALAHDDAKLLVIFASSNYELSPFLEAVRAESSATPVIGCSTAGEISTSGANRASAVIAALGGPGLTITTSLANDASRDLRAAGEQAARCPDTLSEDLSRVLLLLTDGLCGDQREVVKGAYSVLGAATPLVGGCAGDDLRMTATYQLHDDKVFSDCVVSALIGSDGPIGIGVCHGWQPVGESMVVTESQSNVVRKIDGQPALDVYLERLDAPVSVRDDPQEFARFAQTHPLGLAGRTSERVRFVSGADFADRSLVCIAGVPSGARTWLMRGDESSVLDATDTACAEALSALGSCDPIGILAFDCIARRGVLGEEGVQTEIDRISANANGAPVAGFYTYGEIARTNGVSGFHNQTLVVLALG